MCVILPLLGMKLEWMGKEQGSFFKWIDFHLLQARLTQRDVERNLEKI
jgi:1,4-alpha-glucan branching enzyme